MLKLINIKMTDNVIEADYVPENSDKKAHVSLDTQEGKVMSEIIDEYGKTYSRMAVNGLQRISSELKSKKITDVPKERLVMWY